MHDAETLRPRRVVWPATAPASLKFLPDGVLAALMFNGEVMLFDVADPTAQKHPEIVVSCREFAPRPNLQMWKDGLYRYPPVRGRVPAGQEVCVTLLGSPMVGRSTFAVTVCSCRFEEQWDPTIEDSYRKQVQIDGRVLLLDFLDTSEECEGSPMRKEYLRNADVHLCFFSVTDRVSWKSAVECAEQLLANSPVILVSTKNDLPPVSRRVPRQECIEIAARLQVPLIELQQRLQFEDSSNSPGMTAFTEAVRAFAAREENVAPAQKKCDIQ